jgi:hypothetical protein
MEWSNPPPVPEKLRSSSSLKACINRSCFEQPPPSLWCYRVQRLTMGRVQRVRATSLK